MQKSLKTTGVEGRKLMSCRVSLDSYASGNRRSGQKSLLGRSRKQVRIALTFVASPRCHCLVAQVSSFSCRLDALRTPAICLCPMFARQCPLCEAFSHLLVGCPIVIIDPTRCPLVQ